MTDSSTAEELPPQTNGIVDNGLLDDEERARMRPADIDADVREMERRKRVELIMNSKLFREVTYETLSTEFLFYKGMHFCKVEMIMTLFLIFCSLKEHQKM